MRIKFVLFCCVASLSSHASTINWTNTAGGSWSIASNWNPNQVPGLNDVAVITNGGTYTVALSVSASIAGLTVGGGAGTQAFSLSGGRLTLNGTCAVRTNGSFLFTSGELSGTNRLAGNLTWSGGSVTNASVLVTSNSVLSMTSSSTKYFFGTLTNAGTVILSSASSVIINNATRFYNLPGAVFDVQGVGFAPQTGTTSAFHNSGVVRKSAGTGYINFMSMAFHNEGLVDVQVGSVYLGCGGMGHGAFNIAPLATLSFQQGYHGLDGTALTGGGKFSASSLPLVLDGEVTVQDVEWTSGELSGTNRLAGNLTWSGGSVTNASVLVTSNSVLSVTNTGTKYFYGALTNAGTVIWNPGNSVAINSATRFCNLPGAVFDVQGNVGVVPRTGTTSAFHNSGVVRKSAGTGYINFMSMAFHNEGLVDVQVGSVYLGYGGMGHGAFNIAPLATLSFQQGYHGLDGTALTGGGKFSASSLPLVLDGEVTVQDVEWTSGELSGTNRLVGNLTWSGGSVTNASVLVTSNSVLSVTNTGTKRFDGVLTNAGTVVLESPSSIIVGNATSIHNLAGGVFDLLQPANFAIGSGSPVFHNAGAIRKPAGSGSGSFTLSMPLHNTGMVEVESGTLYFSGLTCDGGVLEAAAGSRIMLSSTTTTLNGSIEMENVEISSTTLSGHPTVTGTLLWSGGTIPNGSSLTLASNAILLVQGSSVKTLYGALTNAGTVNFGSTSALLVNSSTIIENQAGGLFDVQRDGSFAIQSGTPVFRNAGRFLRSGGAGSFSLAGMDFQNAGTIRLETGILNSASGVTNLAGTIELAGGTLVPGRPIVLHGGRLSGWGTVPVSVINDGTVAPGDPVGVLTISGNYTQQVNGTLEFGLGGTNAAAYGRMEIAGTGVLSGSINIQLKEGYLPDPGDTFQVMRFAMVKGGFCCYNGFHLLGHNRRFEITSGGTNINLVTVVAPDPTEPTLRFRMDHPAGSPPNIILCWPAEFPGYTLQSLSNLNHVRWIDLVVGTNWISHQASDREMYFRLRK